MNYTLNHEPDLNFYIIDSHRPWDLNNVFLKEGGVFCVDDGDIETGLAVEGGVGEDYAVLLEVFSSFCQKRLIQGDPSYDEDDEVPRDQDEDDDEYDTNYEY